MRRPPVRTCVACRATRPKRELVRVVRPAAGVLVVDLRGKAPGRGAYLCPDEACLTRGIAAGALLTALGETVIDGPAREALAAELRRAAETRTKGGN